MEKMKDQENILNQIIFKDLQESDINKMVSAFEKIGWHKTTSLFLQYLKEQKENKRVIWTAWLDEEFIGYITLKKNSNYSPFQEKKIPEINDFNVLPSYQSKRIGSKLMDLAEDYARKLSATVGLSVGLFKDYGKAQKMYVKRGYIPDGLGITYKDIPVVYNQMINVDDDLALWLTKTFD